MDFDNRNKASLCRCQTSFASAWVYMCVCACVCRAIKSQISIFIWMNTHGYIYGNFNVYFVQNVYVVGCTWFITSWWCICWHLFRRSRHWNDNDIRNESRRYTSWIKKVLFLLIRSFVRCYLSSCRVFRLHSFFTSSAMLCSYFNASSVR